MPTALPFTLQQQITEFLAGLPNLHDSSSQQALIYSAGLDRQLEQKIPIGQSPADFVQVLLAHVSDYGQLADGRDALVAVLEAAKEWLGTERRMQCEALLAKIAEAHSAVSARQGAETTPLKTSTLFEEPAAAATGENPYNCTRPDTLFVGYAALRQKILSGFRNGHSYALLGGRRCGKTSLLRQIARDVCTQAEYFRPYRPIPLYLDMQEFSQLTPVFLFKRIYTLLTREVDAPAWRDSDPGEAYQTFLAGINTAQPALTARYRADWLALLLIDEMDAALAKLSDDQFFQNMRNLLMASDVRRHFRLMASGVKEMSKLILSGSSPLNNLRRQHTRVLTPDEVEVLIRNGFRDGLPEPVKTRVLALTGEHPYLTQGVLEELWDERDDLDETSVGRAAREFLRQHSDFEHWLMAFGAAEHSIYQQLCQTPDRVLTMDEVRKGAPADLVADLDEAALVLSYHGLIDLSDPDQPRLVGTMFRNWYQKMYVSRPVS